MVHHQIQPIVEWSELFIGGQDGEFDDDVASGVEAGHFEIHPHQQFWHGPTVLAGSILGLMKPLASSRVVLRTLEMADFRPWREVRLRNRDWIEPWEPGTAPQVGEQLADRSVFRTRCVAGSRHRPLDAVYPFGIFLHSGELIGEVHLSDVRRGPFQSATVGYWIDKEHAGQGLMPEAVVLVLQFAFDELDLHRVEISIVPRNQASRRVVEKLELRNEGIVDGYLQIRGEWEDHLRYAMTRDEWAERGKELVVAHVEVIDSLR